MVERGRVDEEGPPGVVAGTVPQHGGLRPGARLRGEVDGNTLRLHRPLSHLAKVYIEPTDACNLDCVICFRNAWQTLHRLHVRRDLRCRVERLKQVDPLPTVYFGGIGEPTFHQRTVELDRAG